MPGLSGREQGHRGGPSQVDPQLRPGSGIFRCFSRDREVFPLLCEDRRTRILNLPCSAYSEDEDAARCGAWRPRQSVRHRTAAGCSDEHRASAPRSRARTVECSANSLTSPQLLPKVTLWLSSFCIPLLHLVCALTHLPTCYDSSPVDQCTSVEAFRPW